MPSTVKNLSPVLVELDIEVSAQEIDDSYNKALLQLAREARVRGFRKGKAPLAVLKRMYGKAVLSDLRADIIGRHFYEALEANSINAIGEPEFEAGEIAQGAPYRFTVKVETAPRLEAITFDGIEIDRYPVRVPPQEVDAELERLAAAMATTKSLDAPRPAALGDQVRVEMRKWVDGEWKDPAMPPQEIVLDEESAPPQFLAALPGLGVGEEAQVEFGGASDGGEPSRFMCKVIEVSERVRPAIDDELAKDVGDFETLAALREDMERRIRESREHREKERQRHALFDALRAKNPLDLPERILRMQTDMMKARFAGMLGGQADGEATEAMKRLEEGTEKAAREVVHQHFLLQEIARLEKLAVTGDELEAELAGMSQRTGLPLPKLKAELSKDDRISEIRTSMLERKVFDFALARVKINDTEPPAATDGAEGGKEPAQDA